jgi:hypothetical protein
MEEVVEKKVRKRHISLSAQILTLGIALVVLVSLAISIIFMVNINGLTEKNIKKQAEISLQYLNADLRVVMTSFLPCLLSFSRVSASCLPLSVSLS